ncbi:MAG TPA: hypothetical protein VM120_08060, partial [Bryobacteraceae bacterium]|nr:hypothetical protein [Bryobacteraceae bacterium]
VKLLTVECRVFQVLVENLVINSKNQIYRAAVTVFALLLSFVPIHAQNITLTASPQQLTFNTQTGATTIPQIVLVQSTPGPANVTVSAFSTNNWLQVNPVSGVTPLAMTVAIGPGAPVAGTDIGFINVTSGASTITIPVVLNANSQGGQSNLIATPNSLSFTFPPNSTVPSTQTISVSSTTSAVNSYTARPIVNGGGDWLTVNPASGSLPGSFQVSVNPASLPGAGTFNAVVALSAPGTTGISIPVLVTFAGQPSINVTPAQVSFLYQTGAATPPAQSLTITSSTGVNLPFTATATPTSCGNNWIVLSQQSGATPSTLNIQVNTSGLTAATCTGQINISAPGATNPSVTIPVSLLVSSTPLLFVPSTGPAFSYQIGGAAPATQNVQILSSSSTGLSFSAVATPVSSGPAFLQVSPANGTTPQALTLTVNPASLAAIGPGTYISNVTVTSPIAGNSPQTFPVTLVVSSNPFLISSVQSLNFNYEVGQAVPQNQAITISSAGAPLNYQVAVNTTSCPGFLSATPSSGGTFGGQNQVVVSVNPTGIPPQTCSGNITLSVPGSTTPLLVLPVSFNVSSTPLLNVSQGAITVSALVGSSAITQTLSVTSTNPNTQLPFTSFALTNPIGLTWLSVAPNSGNTPSNLLITINPANLQVGTYNGTVSVASTAPNIPAQNIPVTLTITSGAISATPTSATFSQSAGGPVPASQTVQIAGVPAGTTVGAVATMLNGTGWLTTSVSGNTVTISSNGTQLAQGSYAGVVTVIVPGAANSPLNIPVALTVGAAPTLAVSPTSINFTYTAGSATLPSPQTVQVTSTGGSIPVTATFSPARGGAFITVTPPSGNTPVTLTFAANQAVISTLAPGTYNGTVTVSSPNIAGGNQAINVTLTVTGPAAPVVNAIVNAASQQAGAIAPGEIVTIYGLNIGPATPPNGIEFTPNPNGLVATTLGGATVTFNNIPAPLLYASANVINAIVPFELNGQTTANVAVQLNGINSTAIQVRVVDTAPAILTANASGNGQGSILNENFTVNTATNPAAKGSIIAIYGTGGGILTPGVAAGSTVASAEPFPRIPVNVTVMIGGQPATEIFYAGGAPALVAGAFQINVRIPANVASGNLPVVLTIGGNTNVQQNVTVAVQ